MGVDSRLTRIAERQHGVFSRRQALGTGHSPDIIDGRLKDGSWLREYRAVYRFAGVPVLSETRIMGAVLAAGPGACASLLTAAALWRLVSLTTGRVHVAVDDRRDLRISGVAIHRPRALPARDRTKIGPIPVTTPTRTIMDVAAVLALPDLEIALDDALRRGLVRARTLASRVENTLPYGRRGIPTLRRLLGERKGEAAAESALETTFLRLIRQAGLPRPRPQYTVFGVDGAFIARVDFAYPDVRLAIELDGYAFHEGRHAFDRDRVRQNALIDAGWTILRFTSTDLADGASVVATLHRVLLRCGSGPAEPSRERPPQPNGVARHRSGRPSRR